VLCCHYDKHPAKSSAGGRHNCLTLYKILYLRLYSVGILLVSYLRHKKACWSQAPALRVRKINKTVSCALASEIICSRLHGLSLGVCAANVMNNDFLVGNSRAASVAPLPTLDNPQLSKVKEISCWLTPTSKSNSLSCC